MTAATRRPTVLYVDHTGRISGAAVSLLRVLEILDHEQIRPVLACPPDGPLGDAARALGVTTHPLPSLEFGFSRDPRYLLATLRAIARAGIRLRAIARRERADLVHCNSIRAGIIAACAPLGVPLVVHLRDHLPEGFTSAAGLVSGAVRLLLHCRARRLVAVSRYTAHRFRLPVFGRWKVTTVHNSVDPTEFQRPSDGVATRAALGVADAFPLIGVIGQLTPWKAQDDAIRALPAIVAEYPRARLLIVGEAKFTGARARFRTLDYARELRRLSGELGLEEQVVFTGQRDDVPAITAALDLLVLPSWDEPFGLVVTQAMAAGKPVVATSVGGPAEIVVDGVTGFLVPPRNPQALAKACLRLCRDPEAAREMGLRGQARVAERFSVATEMANLLDLYRDVLQRGMRHTYRRRASRAIG